MLGHGQGSPFACILKMIWSVAPVYISPPKLIADPIGVSPIHDHVASDFVAGGGALYALCWQRKLAIHAYIMDHGYWIGTFKLTLSGHPSSRLDKAILTSHKLSWWSHEHLCDHSLTAIHHSSDQNHLL